MMVGIGWFLVGVLSLIAASCGLIVVFAPDRATGDCSACNGTGGSAGNANPADNWICSACSGTGKA